MESPLSFAVTQRGSSIKLYKPLAVTLASTNNKTQLP